MQRLKTRQESWFFLIKLSYGLIALPFLLFVSIVMAIAINDEIISGEVGSMFGGVKMDDVIFTILVWLGIVVPVILFISSVFSKRRLLKIITNDIKHPDFFMPEPGYEMFHEGDGKYLGIDIQRGTILYVHRIRKGEVDVVGLDMSDWTNREVEGKMFRLYTKIPQLPRIEIATPWAQRWFDTLGSMEFKQYSPSLPFSEYVDIHLEQLEREQHIAIPRLA